jgi:hypothetical protein
MATATELPFLAGTNPRSASSTDWPSMGKSAFGLVSEAQSCPASVISPPSTRPNASPSCTAREALWLRASLMTRSGREPIPAFVTARKEQPQEHHPGEGARPAEPIERRLCFLHASCPPTPNLCRPSLRPIERSEREPESITTDGLGLWIPGSSLRDDPG